MSMTPATRQPQGFDELLRRYPWPDVRPFPDAPTVGRDSSGFEMLYKALEDCADEPVVMEIGSEFGGSTRKFYQSVHAWVISVDPWPDTYQGGSFPEIQPYLNGETAMYRLFQSMCWKIRDRVVGVRSGSPAGPLEVRDAGAKPDLIYIDGDHRYDAVIRDLTISDALFPEAILCGDDWLMKKPDGRKYEHMVVPVQLAVTSWAFFNDHHVELENTTWLIDKERPYNLDPPEVRFRGSQSITRRLNQIQRSLNRIEPLAAEPDFLTKVYRKLRRR